MRDNQKTLSKASPQAINFPTGTRPASTYQNSLKVNINTIVRLLFIFLLLFLSHDFYIIHSELTIW